MSPPRPEDAAGDARRMGVTLFLASLSTLLGASMVGYLVVRLRAETWPPAGVAVPRWLWVSTLLLLGVSLSLHRGVRGVRRGDTAALRRWLVTASLLALSFLASQALAGAALASSLGDRIRGLFAFAFFMLTGLHAVHVLGGLVPLLVTTVGAFRDRYARDSHLGVLLTARYWHFLDAVWLVMLALLLL